MYQQYFLASCCLLVRHDGTPGDDDLSSSDTDWSVVHADLNDICWPARDAVHGLKEQLRNELLVLQASAVLVSLSACVLSS